MEERYELTDPKNQIQFVAYYGISIFGIASIIFLFMGNYIQAIVCAIGFSLIGFFVFLKKQNYKRIYFSKNFLYFDDEQIPLNSISAIEISKFSDQYGIIKYNILGKKRKIFFAGYFKKNLSLLRNFIDNLTAANTG